MSVAGNQQFKVGPKSLQRIDKKEAVYGESDANVHGTFREGDFNAGDLQLGYAATAALDLEGDLVDGELEHEQAGHLDTGVDARGVIFFCLGVRSDLKELKR